MSNIPRLYGRAQPALLSLILTIRPLTPMRSHYPAYGTAFMHVLSEATTGGSPEAQQWTKENGLI